MNLLKKQPITGNKIQVGMDIIHPKSGGIVEVLSVRPPATGKAYHLETTTGFVMVFADEQVLLVPEKAA